MLAKMIMPMVIYFIIVHEMCASFMRYSWRKEYI